MGRPSLPLLAGRMSGRPIDPRTGPSRPGGWARVAADARVSSVRPIPTIGSRPSPTGMRETRSSFQSLSEDEVLGTMMVGEPPR